MPAEQRSSAVNREPTAARAAAAACWSESRYKSNERTIANRAADCSASAYSAQVQVQVQVQWQVSSGSTSKTSAAMRGIVAFLVVVTTGLVSGSAIPMWEFLSRGEKVSDVFRTTARPVSSLT